jgi:hypothetical protein
VLLHTNNIVENVKFFSTLISDDTYVIIEEPPIIRVNLGSSHAMSKIFGAIYATCLLSKAKHVVCVAPRSWQLYLLKAENLSRKKDGLGKVHGDEKEIILSAIANAIVTKREAITNPHILDSINITIYYCKKINGSNLQPLKFGDENGTERQGKTRSRAVEPPANKTD